MLTISRTVMVLSELANKLTLERSIKFTIKESFDFLEGRYAYSWEDYISLLPGCYFSNSEDSQKLLWLEAQRVFEKYEGEKCNSMLAGKINELGDYVSYSGTVWEAEEMLDALGNMLYYKQDDLRYTEVEEIKRTIRNFRNGVVDLC